jgi:hypothetical protein
VIIVKSGIIDDQWLYPDGDVYMWLNRVLYLHQNGQWFDSTIPRIDPPYGYEQHWSRPFDLILYAGAYLGAPWIGFENALYGWAIVISPLLQIISLGLLVWSFWPLLKNYKESIAVLGLLFISQAGIIVSYQAGRADHQSLIFLLFILCLGFGVRLIKEQFKIRWCYGAALAAALAFWVSVESLFIILMNLISLSFFWILGDKDSLRKLFYYSKYLFMLSTVALLAQKGLSRFLEVKFDQISFFYILLFGLTFCFLTIAYLIEIFGSRHLFLRQRIEVVILGLLCIIITLKMVTPNLSSELVGSIDDLYYRIHHLRVIENQPLLSLTMFLTDSWVAKLGEFFLFVGISILSIIILIFEILKNQNNRPWIYLLIGLLIYLPLACMQVRWSPYVTILSLSPYAMWTSKILELIKNKFLKWRAIFLRVSLLFLILFWPYLLVLVFSGDEITGDNKGVSFTVLTKFLDDPYGLGASPKNILAFPDFGPELVYRTKHSVYTIQSHRYHAGFRDNYTIMTAAADETARYIIEKRKVDLILICLKGAENNNYYIRDDKQATFHDRLVNNKIPIWIKEVKLPPELEAEYKLFRINFNS